MIQQGHKYLTKWGDEVIALEPDDFGPGWWSCRPLSDQWLGGMASYHEAQLTPLPMKYFHGQIPK